MGLECGGVRRGGCVWNTCMPLAGGSERWISHLAPNANTNSTMLYSREGKARFRGARGALPCRDHHKLPCNCMQPCLQPCNHATMQSCSNAAMQCSGELGGSECPGECGGGEGGGGEGGGGKGGDGENSGAAQACNRLGGDLTCNCCPQKISTIV